MTKKHGKKIAAADKQSALFTIDEGEDLNF